jgi:23S rRNA pseudouridine1911/1915/1917 synthase
LKQTTESFVVDAAEAGERLDRLVVRHVRAIGRRQARELVERGHVTVDGRRARAGAPAASGSRIDVTLPDPAPEPEPDLPLDVRLERAAVLVVHKPASQATAPLGPGDRGTLANALLGRYPELAGIGHRAREPGLLHRLDTETSGLLIVARTHAAFATLSRALTDARIDKRYLAITAAQGLPAYGEMAGALGPDPERRGRVRVVPDPSREYAREATTRYRVLQTAGGLTLVELEAKRAFRHQIRVHLASIGAPLVGDTLYGGAPWPDAGARHALHASHVAWAGDRTLPSFVVKAELPDDMRRLLGA